MTYLQALVLGALQGLAEFLPVSSSGHLVLARYLLGLGDVPILFDVILHVSTLSVVMIVFRKRVGLLLLAASRFLVRRGTQKDREQYRLILVILVATVATVAIGLGIASLKAERYPRIVSALFLLTAGILISARFAGGRKDYQRIGVGEGLFTGIAQGISVLPGISRSGMTISAALFAGIDREKAGEYSFLIAIPAILGALILELKDVGELMIQVHPGVLLLGVASSFAVGMVSLLLLLRMVKGGKLWLFSIYLVPLGIAGLFFF